jgi:hypothetical protein
MPKGKLSPESEVVAAYGAAMVAAFQVLLSCLEENEAVHPGQFPEALRVYMEMVKSLHGKRWAGDSITGNAGSRP